MSLAVFTKTIQPRQPIKNTHIILSAILLLAASPVGFSQNATIYNRSDSGTNLWENDTPANYPWWRTYAVNRPDDGGRNNVIYDHNVNTTSDVNSLNWYQLRTLTFESSASDARTFNSSGGAGISLTVGFTNNSAGGQTFNVPIGIDDATVTFTNNAGDVTFTDNFYINNNSTIFTGPGNFAVSGNMSGTGGTLTKNGTGRLTVSGTNTYTGGTTLNSGTLVVASSTGLGNSTGAVSIATSSNAILRFNSGTTIGNNVTFSNSGAGSAIEVITGNNAAFRTGTSGSLRSDLSTGTRPSTGYSFLAGNNTTGEQTVKLMFSDVSAASNDLIRISEIINITGMGNVSGSAKDPFVLQLNIASLPSDALLGWLNGSNEWVNATAGNIGSGSLAGFYNGSFSSFLADNGGSFNGSTMLGAWGRDTSSGNVWAVLNHNSDFAIIPEPASWLLLGLGASLLLMRQRARRSS